MKAAIHGLTQIQSHDHNHQDVLSDLTSRVMGLEPMLVREGFVDPAAL